MEIIFTLRSGDRIMLRADEHNYELCRPRSRKDKATGEAVEEWAGFGWYGSLSHALLKIVDMKVRVSEARSLKELATDIVVAQEEIMAAWEPQVEVQVGVEQTQKREPVSGYVASGRGHERA